MSLNSALLYTAVLLIGLSALAYSQLTVFVVQPIGALPEGRTVITARSKSSEFIDSADAMCDRANGGVSLLCRGMMMANHLENSKIFLRLPYSEWLYSISTGGKSYPR